MLRPCLNRAHSILSTTTTPPRKDNIREAFANRQEHVLRKKKDSQEQGAAGS
jgi:hypothetical protein